MSLNQNVSLVAAILGFVILIIGSMGYMGVYVLNSTVCYILMGVGIVMVIAALATISLAKAATEHAVREE